MIEFASANPQLLVQTVVQPNKVPRVYGEYGSYSTCGYVRERIARRQVSIADVCHRG